MTEKEGCPAGRVARFVRRTKTLGKTIHKKGAREL